jgi:hypothetical protein
MERIWLGLKIFSDCEAFLLKPPSYSLKNLTEYRHYIKELQL